MSACQKAAAWWVALHHLHVATTMDTVSCNAAISACSWPKALMHLEMMKGLGLRRSSISYNSVTEL